MIPAEAVEAAAKAIVAALDADSASLVVVAAADDVTIDAPGFDLVSAARAALEAAAPYIAREAVAAELTELAEILEPFSGRVGLANTATRSEVAQWIRGRAAAVKDAKKVRWEAL